MQQPSQIPMKAYWYGQDIEELPREKLLEIIGYLNQQLESTRSAMQSIIEIENLARRRRQNV